MIAKRLFEFLTSATRGASGQGAHGERWVFSAAPETIYAIGDVHGRLDLLRDLEGQIAADAAGRQGETWVILLGDMVDRGPSSAQVVDYLIASPPAGLRRFCLRGNHEALMLDFLRRPQARAEWLEFGGHETLLSYGVPERALTEKFDDRSARAIVDSYVPEEHRTFLEALPLSIETPEAIFVHAGLRPGVALEKQSAMDIMWWRDGFEDDYSEFAKVVVHGHTPREAPLVTKFRIAIDTAAVATGHLTAVRLSGGEPPMVFVTNGPQP